MAISPRFALVPAGEPGISARFSRLRLLLRSGRQRNRDERGHGGHPGLRARRSGAHESGATAGAGILEELPRADSACSSAEAARRSVNLTAIAQGWQPCAAGGGAAAVVRTRTSGGGSGCRDEYWTIRRKQGRCFSRISRHPEIRRVQPLRRTTEAIAPAEHHQLPHSGAGPRGSSGNRLPAFHLPVGVLLQVEGTSTECCKLRGADGSEERQPVIPLWQTRADTITSRLRTVTSSETGLAGGPRPEFETYIGTPVWLGSELFATLSFSETVRRRAPRVFALRPRTDRIDGAQRRPRGAGAPHSIRARPAAKPGEKSQPGARNGGGERKYRHHSGRSGAPGGGAMPWSAVLVAAAEG